MIYTPHPYQKYCIGRVISDSSLGLFLDMGLGKTVITLTAINELKYNRFAIKKVLIIAPKKVAEATWSKEAAKWNHLKHLRFSLVLGSQTKRIKALNTPSDVYIINRDNVSWLVDYYRSAWPFDMVVIDESSSFKNHRSKRFKALKMIRGHINRLIELTGTPAPNGLIDLWAQIYLLDGGQRLGKNITGFRERYFDPDRRNAQQIFTYKPKDGAGGAIEDRIGDICISMKAEDYLQLPDIVYSDIPVALNGPARKMYEKMEREMLLEIDESTIDAGSAAVLSNKLLQLCNGAVYDENNRVVEVHGCKLEAFTELVDSLNGQPALVFYNFQHDRERIKNVLQKSGLRVRELKTPKDETDWNNREIDILLAHPASAAYGLNLQDGGNHMIWFGLNWSLELYQQANKRLHRQGQTQKVIVHHLSIIDTRDEDVIAALRDKGATQDKLIDSLKARIREVKKNEKSIFS